jgi:CO/xanthine dehydrogenase Mo-binding subunit
MYGIARSACIDKASAWVEFDDGGTAKIITGVTEIGEGILTVLAQIAADELGITPEDIVIGDNDTARSPEAAHAGASRQSYMIGNAVALACRDAKRHLLKYIGSLWDVDVELIRTENRKIWVEGKESLSMSMEEAVDICKKNGIIPLGSGNFFTNHTGLDPVNGSGSPWQAYVFGTQVAEVAVDVSTGETHVLGVWAAHDVGRAINPQGIEGQIEGGVVQSMGQAIMENYVQNNGIPATLNFAKYILPTSVDTPKIHSFIIEEPDPFSPLGAKGIGEPAPIPTVPAIINAIYDAVGVRVYSLPASPENVLNLIEKKKNK